MSGDVVARARESLVGITGDGWLHSEDPCGCYSVTAKPDLTMQLVAEGIANESDAGFIAAARSLVPELVSEVERLQGENLTLHESAVHWRGLWQQNTATASAAIAERDAANAEVEKLRGAIETIQGIARDNRHHHAFRRIIDFIERAGIEP